MENKQYTDLLLNQTNDLIWMVDQELQLVFANKAYLNLMKEVTGVEKELNTPILVEGFGEGYIEKWKSYYQKALLGESFTIEEQFFHPGDKEIYYGHISFSPIKDEDGNVLSVACRNTDVTSIVREKYKASSLMDASLDVFCTIDEAGNFVYVSEAAKAHWGYSPDEIINTPYIDLVLKEDVINTNKIAAAIVAGEEVKSFVNRYKRKDGSIAYNLWSAHWDDEAKLMYCVARDAKERIEEEHRLKLLSSVITNTNDAVLITEAEPFDEPGPRIIYVNEAFTKMTGYTAEEVIGKTPRILQGPNSNKEELAKLGNALRNWQPYEITTINYKKNGEEFWINFTVTPVADETGWYTHWIAIERDVTAQKNAELEKALLAQISTCFLEEELNQATRALCKVIQDYADFDLVELWCPNLELTNLSRISVCTRIQDFEDTNNAIFQFLKGEGLPGKVWKQEKQLLWNKEKIAKHFLRSKEADNAGLTHLLGVPLTHQNQITGVLVIGTTRGDASLQKFSGLIKTLESFIGSEINRKRLEDDLKHLYEAIPDILCITDLQGRFLKMNPAAFTLLGYTEEEILFHSFDEFTHPEDRVISTKEMQKLGQGATILKFENRYITKNGRIIWLSWSCNAVVQEGLIYAAAKDITKEKELRQLNRQANSLAKIGSWEVDVEKGTVFWSEMVHRMHETDPETFVPDLTSAIEFYREDFREMVSQRVEHAIKTGGSIDFEAVIVTKNLNERWVQAIGNTEVVNGATKRFFGSFQDITDRKIIELRLKSLSDDLPGVTFQYVITPDGKDSMRFVSKASTKIWGLSPEACETNNEVVWDQIKKGGDFDKVQASIQQSISSGEKWNFRWKNVLPNGELRWHEGFGTPNVLSDGTVVFNSMIFDITEEKKAVLLYEETANAARMGTWEVDLKTEKFYFSKVTREIHEMEGDVEVSFEDGINFYKKEYREIARETIQRSIENGEPWEFELPIITAKGNERWIRGIGQVQLIEDQAVRIYGSFQDIHQRKITELRLKSITNDLPGVTFQYHLYPDGTDRLLTVSKASENIWGLTPEQCEDDIQLVWNQIKKGGDYEQVIQDITHSIQTKTQWHSKWRNVLPDGRIRWHEGFGTPYYQPDGTVVYNSMVFDYTDEKLANDLYEEASEMAKIGNWELNLANQDATDNMYWSPMLRDILEVADDYNPSLTGGFEFYEADSKVLIQEGVEKLISSGTPFDLELLIHTATGVNKWIRCIGNGEFIDGKCVRIFGSFQDIHERKTAELQLKSLTDNLPGVIFQYLLHPEGKDQILYISEGSYKVWGLSPQECMSSPEKIWQQIEAGGNKDDVVASIMKSAEHLSPWYAEWKNISPNGTEKWYEGRGLPQKQKDGAVLWNSVIIDITEKKELEEKYKQSQAERSTILESISDAFYAVDADWNFTYFNREAENLLKKKSEEVLGGNIWEIFSPAKGTILEDVYRRVAKSGQSENFEYHYPGDGCWYEIVAYPSKGGVSVYFKNIDQRKKAAEELEKAYQEKNSILESIGDAFFTIDRDWTVTYWNKQAVKLLDLPKEEIVGKNLWEVFADAIDSDFYRQYHYAMKTGETVRFEEKYETQGKWFEVNVYPSDTGLSIYFTDVTLRKEADERLIKANERFEKVTEATNDAIWDWDIVNDTFYRSQNIQKFFGLEAQTALTSEDFWTDSFHPDDLNMLKESISNALKDHQTNRWEMEYRILNEEGNTLYVIDRGLIIRDKIGKAIRMIGAMADITERKQSEQQLLVINQKLVTQAKELRRSNEELEQFAFITSHDLQEPLRMITSFMDQLDRKYADQLDDKAKQYIHYAKDGAKRMKQIILDLLLYSRINRPTEMQESVNLNEIVSEFLLLRRKLIAEKNAIVHVDHLPELETYKAPVTQLFHCLLDNALKYSRENIPPVITVQVVDKGNFWEFAIKDNGIGIDERFYEKVFIIFQRLHNRKDYDGTGIGLSIAKRAVEFLGGEIWVESKISEGSIFYFTILKKTKYTS